MKDHKTLAGLLTLWIGGAVMAGIGIDADAAALWMPGSAMMILAFFASPFCLG